MTPASTQGMIAAMKIYTKTGDDGSTGLIGGSRVAKNDPRVECYGTVDELNAAIGLAVSARTPSAQDIIPRLQRVQNDLFILGSHLAVVEPAYAAGLPPLTETLVTQLEQEIDAADQVLPPLTNFILPGGSELAARLHVARTTCRRAERLVVALASAGRVSDLIVRYLNRLGDWLFVQARLANHQTAIPDVPWQK